MIVRRVLVSSANAILVKALLEGNEGLACVFGERGGDLTLTAPEGRERELDEVLATLEELLSSG